MDHGASRPSGHHNAGAPARASPGMRVDRATPRPDCATQGKCSTLECLRQHARVCENPNTLMSEFCPQSINAGLVARGRWPLKIENLTFSDEHLQHFMLPNYFRRSSGRWLHAVQRCQDEHDGSFCTPTGYRWSEQQWPSGSNTCARLQAAGISSIAFVGESFTRHLYVATALLLSGNHISGALQADAPVECLGEGQFSEKECRAKLQRTITTLCDGRLKVQLMQDDVMPSGGFSRCVAQGNWSCMERPDSFAGNAQVPLERQLRDFDAVVWSFGTHRIPAVVRSQTLVGGFDASGLEKHVLRGMMCDSPEHQRLVRQKLVWFYVPVRVRAPFEGSTVECPDNLARYQVNIEDALRRVCDVSRFVNLWDPSLALVQDTTTGWKNMTWDGVHYTRALNLVGATQLVNELSKPVPMDLVSPGQ